MGKLDLLKWFHNKYSLYNAVDKDNFEISHAAARGGNLKLVRWLKNRRYYFDEGACCEAAAKGHLEVLQWLKKHKHRMSYWTFAAAKKNDQHHVLEWLKENGCNFTENDVEYAALRAM